jgi:8-oxo-dGTP pyrophosphatase MutT (NUDIX family)
MVMDNPLLTTLKNYHPVKQADTPLSAAVLMLFVEDDAKQFSLLLTQRSAMTLTYVRDYCFPGGMRDPEDADLQATAMREVSEELGLPACSYQIIAELDDFHTHDNNLVRPFVGVMSASDFSKFYQNTSVEIDNLAFVSLADLTKIETDKSLEEKTHRHPSYSYRQENIFVWGLTANMMVHLANIIFHLNRPLGKHKSVL